MAAIGLVAGQIYRSDLANLKAYRLPPAAVNLATRFLLPLVGALRPPRRPNRALPDDPRTSTSTTTTTRNAGAGAITNPPAPDEEEIITTARRSQAPATLLHRHNGPGLSAGEEEDGSPGTTGSVMREWVDELTGRSGHAAAGIRVPPEEEINQLTMMFPDVQRDVVVAALQRRSELALLHCVFFSLPSVVTCDLPCPHSSNIEAAVETLLVPQT